MKESFDFDETVVGYFTVDEITEEDTEPRTYERGYGA